MKGIFSHFIEIIIGLLNVSILFKGLDEAFKTETSWLSDEGSEILNNPEDKSIVEDAINKLNKGETATESVTLSTGRTINIRIG